LHHEEVIYYLFDSHKENTINSYEVHNKDFIINHSFYSLWFLRNLFFSNSQCCSIDLLEPFFAVLGLLLFILLIISSKSFLISLVAYASTLPQAVLLSLFTLSIAYTKTSHLISSKNRKRWSQRLWHTRSFGTYQKAEKITSINQLRFLVEGLQGLALWYRSKDFYWWSIVPRWREWTSWECIFWFVVFIILEDLRAMRLLTLYK